LDTTVLPGAPAVLASLQKSFEEVQAAVRARKQAAAGTSGSNSSAPSVQADAGTTQQQQPQQDQVYLLRSSWADGMRGRFVTEQPGDPSVPGDAGSTEPTAAAAADPDHPGSAAT
jgi:hypothetical protein